MLIALPLAVGLVAALGWRHREGPGGWRLTLGVGGLALAIRLGAVIVIQHVAYPVHDTGVWLADEASFFLATEALWPAPLGRALPQGLEHLGGDGYLGLAVMFAWLGRVADVNTARVVNAGLGAAVVLVCALMARRLFGFRAALVSGVVLSVWPTLVLWSATMLRDTLGSIAIVAAWWALARSRDLGWPRTLGAIFLSLVILLSLRPYLGGALVAGVAAWAMVPLLRRARPRTLALGGAAGAILAVGLLVSQARRIDAAAHELFYRQTVARMETLGRLYTDQPEPPPEVEIRPGLAVALVEPGSGWLLAGIVQQLDGSDLARVAFTDESIREVHAGDVVLLSRARIPPLELIASSVPNLLGFVSGTSTTSEASSPAWVGAALAWDALAIAAALALARARPNPREWLLPACVVGGTVLALVAVPGAPGNAERHRATQTVPLLAVLASGLLAPGSRRPDLSRSGPRSRGWRFAARRRIRETTTRA